MLERRLFIAIALTWVSGVEAAATAPPADDVTCIYNALSVEDREIALIMFAEGTQNAAAADIAAIESAAQNDAADAGDKAGFGGEHMGEVMELLEEAHMRCLDLYPWTSGQSEASRLSAFLGLMDDAITRMLKLDQMDGATLDNFYETNKKKFVQRSRLNKAEKLSLTAHLRSANWKVEDTALLAMAQDYTEALMMKEMLRRAFVTGDFSKLDGF